MSLDLIKSILSMLPDIDTCQMFNPFVFSRSMLFVLTFITYQCTHSKVVVKDYPCGSSLSMGGGWGASDDSSPFRDGVGHHQVICHI